MSKVITVADDYIWSTLTGLYEWVIEYLRDAVPQKELWEHVEREGDLILGNLFVSDLPEPGRRQVLQALARDVPRAYEQFANQPPRTLSPEQIRGLVHHLEILAMMATEVLRGIDAGERP